MVSSCFYLCLTVNKVVHFLCLITVFSLHQMFISFIYYFPIELPFMLLTITTLLVLKKVAIYTYEYFLLT